jgi:hypothetical protein
MTPDRIFYPLAALVAGGLIALAAVYPQGQGARSPGPFGHTPSQQTAAAMAMARRDAKLDLEIKQVSQAMKNQQLHDGGAPIAPAAPVK